MKLKNNPVIYSDFPDPDIIRVEDTYYMASTTMHYMPGCDILRSYNLADWEFVTHAYDTLDDTPGHNLEGDNQIYGQGMWAPSLRFHKGIFYICFTANDTHKTYLLTAKVAEGPWKKRTIEGFYYDSSLFFDDDERVYIVHGQKDVYLTELDQALTGPRKGGLHRLIVQDEDRVYFGYEGSHLYKYKNRYYLFTCHMLAYGKERKTEDCFTADTLEGEFKGRCIIDDDMGYHNLGVAQGGMIDTPEGEWYAFMFQDMGALGRSPVMIPMHFDEDDFPVIGMNGRVNRTIQVIDPRPDYIYAPLNGDDDFLYSVQSDGKIHLKPFWQFNHNPVDRLWSVTDRKGAYRIYSDKTCTSLPHAYNTLTQRTLGPVSAASVTVDGSGLKSGDYAGICAFIGCYGAIAVTKEDDRLCLVMFAKPVLTEDVQIDSNFLDPAVEYARIPLQTDCITLRAAVDFTDMRDTASFAYLNGGNFIPLGIEQKQYFKLDHFTGCRFGLFLFSTKETGGRVDFMNFSWKS